MFHNLNLQFLLVLVGQRDVIKASEIVTMIQGSPLCPTTIQTGPNVTPMPQDCDQLCLDTANCNSFTWSRQTSKCELYETQLNTRCPVESSGGHQNTFWSVPGFFIWRRNFTDWVTLTKANNWCGTDPLCLPLGLAEHTAADISQYWPRKLKFGKMLWWDGHWF